MQTKEQMIKIKNKINTNNQAKLRYSLKKQSAESKKTFIKKFNAKIASGGNDDNYIKIIEEKEVWNNENIEKESPKTGDIKPKTTNKDKTDELKEDIEKTAKNEDSIHGKKVRPDDDIKKVDSANDIVYPVLVNATAQDAVDYFSTYT